MYRVLVRTSLLTHAAVPCVSQESLRESSCQVTLLQQRERETALERERERERELERDRSTAALRELEVKVQALVERGLVRLGRSSSGHLDVQVVAAETQKGQSVVSCEGLVLLELRCIQSVFL